MSKGLTIPLSLDPREWIRGIKVVEDTVEDFADELEDTEDTARTLGRKLEDVFDDATREVRRTEDALDDMGRGGKNSLRDIDRGADRAERSLDDMRDEAQDSAREFGASFRGDPIEALEEVQSYVSNVISSMAGPLLGTIGTIAGAAGIGLIVSKYQEWKERQEEINARAAEFIQTMAEASASIDTVIEKELARDVLAEQSVEARLALVEIAQREGKTQEEVVTEILKGRDLLAEQQALAADLIDTTDIRTRNLSDAQKAQIKAENDYLDAITTAYDALGDIATAVGRAKDARIAEQTQVAKLARQDEQRLGLIRTLNDEYARPITKNVTIVETRQRRGAGNDTP